MHSALFSFALIFLSLLFPSSISAQSLVVNEVSQGESGNQEYIELIVVDNTVVFDCQNTQPPCIDIRGWIFDDNSGYHGTNGIATGAIRFSFDNLWSCVPLGTIILIYNGADPNSQLPADDLSLSDGNCTIVVPVNNTVLFEGNLTTPGAVACSYPTTGWTPGGDWMNTLLANGGDCARIVDVAGCEVFSVCWGSNNQNNQIYFSGGSTSTTSATNTVYYFNGNDPAVQSNWTIGCADVSACGVENQTPGAPNNTANAAYIGQFNNNCMPITPLIASAIVDNDASCVCNGQATASASGSTPGYSYEWYDNLFAPIGQTTATATNLCAGTYNVVITSTIGCTDTSQVTITGTNNVSVSVNLESICAGETISLIGTPSSLGGIFAWSPSGESTPSISVTPTTTSTYTVYYSIGSCMDSAEAIITVNPIPIINAGTDITLCSGQNTTLSATGGISYTWDNGITNGVAFNPNLGTTVYTVTGTDVNGCSASDIVSVTVLANPTANASFTPSSGIAPLTVDFANLGTGGSSYFWNFGNGQSETTLSTSTVSTSYESGTYTITLTVSNGSCQSTWTGFIEVLLGNPALINVPNVFTPNGDQINDVFFINSENLASLEGSIFNRWGNLMFTFDTIDFSWDGTSSGRDITNGTYFIKYRAIGLDQKEYEGHTFFQLIR